MAKEYADEHYHVDSLILEKKQTKVLKFGTPTTGRILVSVNAYLSLQRMGSRTVLSVPKPMGSGPISPPHSSSGGASTPGDPGEPNPPLEGNRNKVTYIFKKAGVKILEGKGTQKFQYESTSETVDNLPWALEITNTADEKYYIKLNIYYTGSRKIKSKEVYFAAFQENLDEIFKVPDFPVRLVLENRTVKEEITLSNGQKIMRDTLHTFTKIDMNVGLKAILEGDYSIPTEKDLGFKLVDKDVKTNPINATITTIDGHLALRLDFFFKPLKPARFHYVKETWLNINLFEFDATIHRMAFAVFLVMQPRPGQGMVYSITRIDDFFANPFKVELLHFDVHLPFFLVDLIGALPSELITKYSENIFETISKKLLEDPTFEFIGFEQKLWTLYAEPNSPFPVPPKSKDFLD